MIWIIYVISTLAGLSLLDHEGLRPTHEKLGKPARVEYRTWLSSPSIQPDGSCRYTVFALVTREQVMRVQMQGEEQLLDWSWSKEWVLKQQEKGTYQVTFLQPVGGATQVQHEVDAWCHYRKEAWE